MLRDMFTPCKRAQMRTRTSLRHDSHEQQSENTRARFGTQQQKGFFQLLWSDSFPAQLLWSDSSRAQMLWLYPFVSQFLCLDSSLAQPVWLDSLFPVFVA